MNHVGPPKNSLFAIRDDAVETQFGASHKNCAVFKSAVEGGQYQE